MDRSHQVNVSLQEHHSHQVQVWFMWERESPRPGEKQLKTQDNTSGWVTVSEQCNHIPMLPRWVPETLGPGEAQVGPET